ncbi:MAG: hypothetical protein ACLFVI_08395 [Archaeoglobaceae archaeon]
MGMGVDFDIFVDQRNIKKCGLKCREVSVTLRNTGDADAHDINVRAEFFCKGKLVEANKRKFQEFNLDSLKSKVTRTETFRLEVGLKDSICIKSSGVKVVFTITSREKIKKIEKMFYL